MAEKLFYTMGEVAEMFDVNASLIRYWGTQFPALKPHRNKKGNRLFTPADIETLKRIYHYVKECGMTLEGANRALRGDRSQAPESNADMELLDRLHDLRSMLVAVRDSLGEDTPQVATPAATVAPQPAVEVAPAREAAASEAAAEPAQPAKPMYREQTLFDF
jgi:DNA-binding transcriptional MerR regulator